MQATTRPERNPGVHPHCGVTILPRLWRGRGDGLGHGRLRAGRGENEQSRLKHGVGFQHVTDMMRTERFLHFRSDRHGEERHVAILKINDAFFSVVFTWRGEKVRIISARRARDEERRRSRILFEPGR
jgi:uncharacterized DUF497 family protein